MDFQSNMPYLEDHPPIYKPWSSAIWKGNVALIRGRKLTMVTDYLLNGMILQVDIQSYIPEN